MPPLEVGLLIRRRKITVEIEQVTVTFYQSPEDSVRSEVGEALIPGSQSLQQDPSSQNTSPPALNPPENCR